MSHLTIEEAIEEIKAGRMVILVDDEDRENEGDLCMAAEAVTPESINFMARYGRGLICLSLTSDKCDALDLPFDNGEFDVAVSTQVYEYVADMDGALAELHRVLSPGGRALTVDTDWDSIVLHSDEPELTRQILTVWDEHLVDPHLPRRLRSMLSRAGFVPGATSAIPIVNTEYDENTYSHGMLGLISSFVSGRSGVEEEDVERWHAGIVALAERGEYFVSVNRYLFVAEKPG